MKVNFTKAVRVLDGNGREYRFSPGETFIDDSLLAFILDNHLDAIKRSDVTAMQDRVSTVKASNPSINTAAPRSIMYNASDVTDSEGEMEKPEQVGLPSATGEDAGSKNTGTHTDEFGNVINENVTVTTPGLAFGSTSKTVGKANPALITVSDTPEAKVRQSAKANSSSSTSANGSSSGGGAESSTTTSNAPSGENSGTSSSSDKPSDTTGEGK